jgi:hypothetical protein
MSLDQRSQKSHAFEKQWSELRKGDEPIPPQKAFDPIAFVDYLPVLVLAEIDLDEKTMPIRLAGNLIRDFVGFELTGKDFLEYDTNPDTELGWEHRRAYHDHPCGRYEVLDIKFGGGFYVECALTILPLIGEKKERIVAVFVEPFESKVSVIRNERAAIAETVKFGVYLDISAGVPDPT